MSNPIPVRLCMFVVAVAIGTVALAHEDGEPDATEPRWLERLDQDDREPLTAAIGFAPPAFPADLLWVGVEAPGWEQLRGKVVVMQSWTSATSAGRSWPVRLHKALEALEGEDLVLLTVHTPQGAENAETFLERRPSPVPVAVDSKGAFCDALGFYKRPVNVVVDRNGTVRYAGLNQGGLVQAVQKLLAEPFDPKSEPVERSVAAPAESASFPSFSNPVRSASDFRGRRAPEFFVQQWVNGAPEESASGTVTIIDFWATWCGPCVAAIPHMNELAERFRGQVTVVGVSDEAPDKFQQGMNRLQQQRGLSLADFRYHVALDPSARMKGAVGVRGIPHIMIMSADWIVRWQGHPMELTPAILEQIVAASAGGTGRSSLRSRWTGHSGD